MRFKINSTGQEILADEPFMQAVHAGDYTLIPDAPVLDTTPRHISVGSFFDRFGTAKWAILADVSPSVQAVVKDASVRKHIDLDNPDLPMGLAIVSAAGHAIDADAIINAPVSDGERP